MVKLTLVDQDANEINHAIFNQENFYNPSEYIKKRLPKHKCRFTNKKFDK